MQKIDWNEMFKYTGDPFVDAGGFVLQELMECYPDADIMTLIMMVTDIYVKLWDAKNQHIVSKFEDYATCF